MSGKSSDEIRELVREALREFMPPGKAKPEAAGGTFLSRLRSALLDPRPARVEVKIATDADLKAFARDLLQVPEDVKAGILSGRIELGLGARGGASASAP